MKGLALSRLNDEPPRTPQCFPPATSEPRELGVHGRGGRHWRVLGPVAVRVNCPTCGAESALERTLLQVGPLPRVRLHRCPGHGRFWTSETLLKWEPKLGQELGHDAAGGLPANRPRTAGGLLGGLGGDSSALVLVSESGLNPNARSSPNRARALRIEPPRFSDFWTKYPRKKARKKALEYWVNGKLEQEADSIIVALISQLPEFEGREPDRVPHPATWLNQERWKDEPDRAPRPVGRPRAPESFAERDARIARERADAERQRDDRARVAVEARLARDRAVVPASRDELNELRRNPR